MATFPLSFSTTSVSIFEKKVCPLIFFATMPTYFFWKFFKQNYIYYSIYLMLLIHFLQAFSSSTSIESLTMSPHEPHTPLSTHLRLSPSHLTPYHRRHLPPAIIGSRHPANASSPTTTKKLTTQTPRKPIIALQP
jgi:hypothetical protein